MLCHSCRKYLRGRTQEVSGDLEKGADEEVRATRAHWSATKAFHRADSRRMSPVCLLSRTIIEGIHWLTMLHQKRHGKSNPWEKTTKHRSIALSTHQERTGIGLVARAPSIAISYDNP